MENSTRNLFNDNEVLLVTGSMNANQNDRYLPRDKIKPVQLIMDNQVIPVDYFNSWGEYGVSSFAWDNLESGTLYFSTGKTPYKLDLQARLATSLQIDKLQDVHEIEFINNHLWLSNTGKDEAVAINMHDHKVAQTIALKELKNTSSVNEDNNDNADYLEKYHCNQITEGYQGELYALVHHTSGIQMIRKVANKLIKNQGNGGVINLETGDYIDLKLKSPHSIRKIDNNYWIFDSGNARAHIYDQHWKLLEKVATRGFARGSSLLEKGIVCAGISETRKRYLNIIKSSEKVQNMVQFFDANTLQSIAEVVIPDIEQVNNVYTIDRQTAQGLLNLH